MSTKYNLKSPAVKRLMREAAELKDPTYEYHAQPLEENLFEWHFTVRGPSESEFEGGIYHGRILLPPEYPMKPPSIILLTPNGRFEVNRKICLSISGYHPESWQPSWSIRTALLAIIGFMPSPGQGAIGSLDFPAEERKKLSVKSQTWSCETCGLVKNLLLSEPTQSEGETASEAKELAAQITMKGDQQATSSTTQTAPEDSEEHRSGTPSIADTGNDEIPQSEVRQRNVIHVPHPVIIDNAPEVISRQVRDRASDALLWLIMLAILFLLVRRLFFLSSEVVSQPTV